MRFIAQQFLRGEDNCEDRIDEDAANFEESRRKDRGVDPSSERNHDDDEGVGLFFCATRVLTSEFRVRNVGIVSSTDVAGVSKVGPRSPAFYSKKDALLIQFCAAS